MLGVSDLVHFTGWVGQEDVRDWLRGSDVFVLPSIMEGLSIALLQAMASGLPLIASTAVGNREVIRDGYNGLSVPPQDTDALADALVMLIGHSGIRREMGERGEEMATQYDWRVIAQSYLQILEASATGS